MILYIDTSSRYLYSAIVDSNKVVEEIKEEDDKNLSEVALPKIARMFEKSGLEPTDIKKIIVVNGPGSFTGIRIGLTIAKVYAWSLNIPITTIYSLEAMSLSGKKETNHVPMIDARRGFVYAAIYGNKNEEILKPQHIKLEELKEKLKNIKEYEIITNDEFDDFSDKTSYDPNILKIVDFFKDRKKINPHAVNPEYLKLTEAEESKK